MYGLVESRQMRLFIDAFIYVCTSPFKIVKIFSKILVFSFLCFTLYLCFESVVNYGCHQIEKGKLRKLQHMSICGRQP